MRLEVPEWGGHVYVRGLTARERDEFEIAVTKRKGGETIWDVRNVRARLCVIGLCDEQGRRLFSDEEIPSLGKKSALVLERCFDTIRHLSGMTDADLAELEGNSPAPSDDSPSD
jgi:hypothetical protein